MDMIQHESKKHKSLLFKERSCLGWTKFKIIRLWIVLHEKILRRVNVSGCPQRYMLLLNISMIGGCLIMHIVELAKISVYLGHSVSAFYHFFQDNSMAVTENEVGCNGKAVKKFSDMIKHSLRDDDFVSRKCMTFNVVLFHCRICFSLSYLLLMVRFVNDFFVYFSFLLS